MALPSEKIDRLTVLHGAIVVTMDGDRNVYACGGLAMRGDRIIAVGEDQAILADFASGADDIVDLSGRLIIPGLINTHVHTSQQLGRGIADDVDLLTWLHKRIWPYESSMTDSDSFLSTLLCGIELIRSGVTCFAEAGGQHVPAMARAVELLGIRACLTRSTMDSGEGLPSSWATETTDSCLTAQEELYKSLNGSAGGRIRVWFGLRQIMNATDALLLRTKEAADKYNTGIHMHVSEIPYENEYVIKTRGVENGTVTHLDRIGVLGENLLAAHSVWINEGEVKMMAKSGVKVSHCPASAMRMLGFCPVQEMLEQGVCVSIGTDGAPSNNRMSMVDEMYLASLINKGKLAHTRGTTDPTALPAETVLEMATINGAKSVLWDNEIGSIEVHKKADFVVINPQTWSMVPLHDPISSLVYSMRSENIESVICDGVWIMRDRKILTIEEATILKTAAQAAQELIHRAGIQLPERMKVTK
ncbi:hypothetical protein SELMODRAFT_431949 [Selaginella moellendorffii]|uniref:Amidohydrolase-related domain-containing protein n=1 Tax=Selaginella moellendorffii TaxID=88036 RepID=D8TEH0_SELML|nr:uncharacterized protein LOC9636605 [Selaginella moellendorffii]XP_024523335.1 uncharacterized protein LOC9636605 [Selaginella moellendorffii]XP_024523336.1 uncharacterized protein LOC9636605 [Selaginella moellendorffii]EFJ04925.1 hypothetical protein SELMODRAFT_431949 [Selaginella moellendorffii]|eukprot:XP_002993985.1 uncharacterized protein LOC9636605 [Selaginella moellendorffii]